MFSNASLNLSTESLTVEDCYLTYVVRKPTTSYIINSVFGCVVNAILAVFGTFLNALVVCIFWKTPRLQQKVSYFMIMVLSSIDLCVSTIVHPFHLVNSIAEVTETSKCFYKLFYQTSAVILSGMSYLTFFVMNIERYISIVHPFFHRVHVTKRRCLFSSFLLWLACIVAAICYVFNVVIQSIVAVFALIILIGTLYIYISIYYIARKQRNFRQSTIRREVYVTEVQRPKPELKERGRPAELSNKAVSFLHDLALAKMYFVVVACNLLLNLPNVVILAVYTERVKTLDDLVQMKIWTLTLVATNSTANCIIFFWANKKLRSEGWKICKTFLSL